MAIKRVKIGEVKPHPMYIPKDLVEDGFVGEVIILPNAMTATIVRPGASLDDAIRSLGRIIDDLKHRKEKGIEFEEEAEHGKKKKKGRD